MKKWIAMVIMMALLCMPNALATEAEGVQIIGGAEGASINSWDDIQMQEDIEIDGYGILTPTGGEYTDGWHDHSSGGEAEFLLFYLKVLNTNLTPATYMESCSAKVIFDDVYEFEGSCFQSDRENDAYYYYDLKDVFSINPLYYGYYFISCTLPNFVVNSDKPLRLEFNLDGYEFVYNIRK